MGERQRGRINICFFIVFLLLTFGWMIVIYRFSAQQADASPQISRSFGKKIGQLFIAGFEDWEPAAQERFSERIDYPVRKAAHASEFALLAILFFGTLKTGLGGKRFPYFLIAFLASSFYAVTDEWHQIFVPGRSGQAGDVLLDAAGALFGCIFVQCVLAVYRRRKKSQTDGEIR